MDWVDLARKQREVDHITVYGPIRPKTDRRCFRREALEELIDAISYVQWSKEKGEINRQQWRRMDSGIRAVIRTLEAACNDRFEWERIYEKSSWKKVVSGIGSNI